MALPMIGMGLGMALPLLMMGGMGNMGGGMNGCCDGVFGGEGAQNGTMMGGLAGGVLGGVFGGGLPGALLGGFGGAALGNLLGRLFDRHHHHHHHHHGCPGNYGPPQGCPWGGQSNGCYGPQPGFQGPPGYYGPPQGGQYGGQYGAGDPYSQGYQQGYQNGQQYNQGYQQGYQDGMQSQYGQQWPPRNCWQPGGGDGCRPVNQGQLTQEGEGKPIHYTTRGGWNVTVDHDKLIATDPSGQHKIEWSGDPHEYVDGKHVKDWDGKTRSMILPDGTKFTGNADSPNGVMKSLSIYDGNRNIQINNNGNEITHQSFNPWDTRAREAWQADGETAVVQLGRGGLNYSNLYTQDQNLGFRSTYQDLGTFPNTRPPFTQQFPWFANRLAY